ncbi:MAG: D-alanyl-D-alanine carboxypeptidase family protein [Dehalococcoidia bacterium]
MAYQPYDPFRGRTGRSRPSVARRRYPTSALALIAVLPALLVSALLLWRFGGDDGAAAAATAGLAGATSGEASEGNRAGGPLTRTEMAAETATPSPSPSFERPRSLGLLVPELSASAVIVVDDASMEVLYALDGYSPRPPASVTKMATAVVAMEHGRLDEVVTSSVHYWDLAFQGDSTTMGLEPDDQVTLRELLYGLMLVSGNDAAKVIAEHVAGSEEAFVAEMNELAERLGMEDTHFVTVDGLSAPGHVSSPWDLVLLSRYLMRFPDLREIVGTEEYTAHGLRDGAEVGYELYNHNPLLNYTPGVDGIKTGFTEEAGRTFALTAQRDGHRVYIVLMDSALRAQDSLALVDWVFANHVWPGDLEPPSPTPEPPFTSPPATTSAED